MRRKAQRNIKKTGKVQYTFQNAEGTNRNAAAGEKKTEDLFACLVLSLLSITCLFLFNSTFTADGSLPLKVLLLTALSVLFTLDMQGRFGKKAKLVQCAAFFVLALLFRKELTEGFIKTGNEILVKCNKYYDMQFAMLHLPGETLNRETENGTLILTVLGLFTLWMAYALIRTRKFLLVLLPPALILSLGLSVGYAPKAKALILLLIALIGVLVYTNGKWDKESVFADVRMKTGFLILAGCTAAVLGIYHQTEAKAQKLTDSRKQIEEFQSDCANYAIDGFLNIKHGFKLTGMEHSGRITNMTPMYEDKEILSLEASKKPEDTVYLKGYVGDSYKKGTWKNGGKRDFERETAGWEEDIAADAGARVQSMLYETQLADDMQYKLSYLDVDKDYVYAPYYTTLRGAFADMYEDKMTYIGDSMVRREDDNAIAFSGSSRNRILVNYDSGLDGAEKRFADYYNEYVKRYTGVPEDLTQIRELGDKLKQECGQIFQNNLQNDIYSTGSLNTAQLKELYAVYLVKRELGERAYSLDLASTPFGADVTENFLFHAKEGYCEHFASAGALLLRRMGIPARYVSGYAVERSEFKENETGGYTAEILDNEAHAWVEIYMENTGWIPVEMTWGNDVKDFYFTTEQGTPIVSDNTEEAAGLEQGGQTENDTERNTETEQGTQNEVNQNTEKQKTRVPPNKTSTMNKRSCNKELGILAACVLLLLAAVCIRQVVEQFIRRRWLSAVRKGENRKAAAYLVTDCYRLMKRKRMLRGKIKSDVQLKEQMYAHTALCPEAVDIYIEIAERLAFSQQPITRKDVMECWRTFQVLKSRAN